MLRSYLLKPVLDLSSVAVVLQQHRNPFFDGFFRFASFLGSEEVYVLIFVIFWSVLSTSLAWQITLMWAVGFYICNVLKDSLRLPRPSLPVVAIETKYAAEFGWPSTHAWNSVVVALFVVLHFERYLAPQRFTLLASASILFVVSVGLSRVYLGVHSAFDVLSAIFLAYFYSSLWIFIEDSIYSFAQNYNWSMVAALYALTFAYPRRLTSNSAFVEACCALGTAAGMILLAASSSSSSSSSSSELQGMLPALSSSGVSVHGSSIEFAATNAAESQAIVFRNNCIVALVRFLVTVALCLTQMAAKKFLVPSVRNSSSVLPITMADDDLKQQQSVWRRALVMFVSYVILVWPTGVLTNYFTLQFGYRFQ